MKKRYYIHFNGWIAVEADSEAEAVDDFYFTHQTENPEILVIADHPPRA